MVHGGSIGDPSEIHRWEIGDSSETICDPPRARDPSDHVLSEVNSCILILHCR